MDIINTTYFTFFSIGSLIPVIFHLLITFFFFTIPGKSRATFHIAMGYLFMTLFNFAYVISSSLYHPSAAYHRWLTVGVIILGETHFNMFMLHFGGFRYVRFARAFLAAQYLVSLVITALFCRYTLHASKVFHFDGHYWDFDADRISALIGVVIMVYLLVFIVIMTYKATTLRGRGRWIALLMGITYCAATIAPSFTNTLSRRGLLDREIFQISWALLNVFGFFLLAVIYINNSREKTNFLAKVIGISMVTLLVLLQGLSYLSTRDMERAFCDLRRQETARMVADRGYRPPDLVYLSAYSLDTGKPRRDVSFGGTGGDGAKKRIDAAVTRERLVAMAEVSASSARDLLAQAPPYFRGYRDSILEYIESSHGEKISAVALDAFIAELGSRALVFRRKIAAVPQDDTRRGLERILRGMDPPMRHFRAAMETVLRNPGLEGNALRGEMDDILAIPSKAGTSRFLENDGVHTVSYIHLEPSKNLAVEAGFSYLSYRRYVHPSSLKLIITSCVLVVFVLVGFRIFFLGAFVYPQPAVRWMFLCALIASMALVLTPMFVRKKGAHEISKLFVCSFLPCVRFYYRTKRNHPPAGKAGRVLHPALMLIPIQM